MDDVTMRMVTAQLKTASGEEALHDAIVSALIAVVECQYKTGKRVKRQGMILCGVALLIVVALLCSPEAAATLLRFGRG